MNVMRPRTDKIEISGNLLTGVFHIYIFKQANAYIAYCPSIDLAVSGNSIRNAEESFQESVSIHLDYQIKNKELLKDLKKHKWKRLYLIKNKKKPVIDRLFSFLYFGSYVKYILVTRPTSIQSKLEIQYNKGNLSPTKNNR